MSIAYRKDVKISDDLLVCDECSDEYYNVVHIDEWCPHGPAAAYRDALVEAIALKLDAEIMGDL